MAIKEFNYDVPVLERGYAGKTLYINLDTLEIKIEDITKEMKEKFTGGKGFDLYLMWKNLPKDKRTKWNDPENEIIFCTGPICGVTQYSGTGKTHVVTLSPETETVNDNNVKGSFRMMVGDPADSIKKCCKEEKIDLIVMNANNRSWIKRVIMGSVTDEVLRTSSVPVLVLRPKRR